MNLALPLPRLARSVRTCGPAAASTRVSTPGSTLGFPLGFPRGFSRGRAGARVCGFALAAASWRFVPAVPGFALAAAALLFAPAVPASPAALLLAQEPAAAEAPAAAMIRAAPATGTLSAPADAPPLSTFSIVACDPGEGFIGIGIQSRVVSAGSIVPAAEAGVGAVASQAAANVAYKREGLRLLAEGRTPEEVRAHFLATDDGSANRQYAIMDAECRFATHTGESTLAWSGHRIGRHYSAQGNILTGPEVVDAMAEAFERAEGEGLPFGERILAALKAAQDAGGDRRGQQGAGLLIVKEGSGYGGGDDRYADLRVEDHVAPITELERVYDVWMSLFHPEDHFLPKGSKPIPVARGPHVCLLRTLLADAGYGEAPAGGGGCAMDDAVISALKAFQEAEGLPVTPNLSAETSRRLMERGGV